MSLLLDALQRASEEKEKLATARAPDEKHEAMAGGQQSPLPTLMDEVEAEPPVHSPEPRRDEALPAEPPSTTGSLPSLEFSALSDFPPHSEDSISPSGLPQVAKTPPERSAPEISQHLELEMASAPEAKPIATFDNDSFQAGTAESGTASMGNEPGSHSRTMPPINEAASSIKLAQMHPGPVTSSQIAKDILEATAKPSQDKRRRLLAIATIAVLIVIVGTLFALDWFNTAPIPDPVFNPHAQQDPIAVEQPPVVAPQAAAGPESTASGSADAGAPPLAPLQSQQTSSAQAPIEQTPVPAHAKPIQQTGSGKTNKPVFIAAPAAASSLDAAYAALKEGRFDDASASYQLALTRNGGEVDALLGLAYIAQRRGHSDEARTYYSEVLRQVPGHPAATAGMLSIVSEGDIQAATSRAGEVAQRNPDSAIALSSLGNLLARQGRIAEAQQAYFRAFTLEPANALHAYNLAVALDRLHKYPQALQYYKHAIALSENLVENEQAGFPRSSALQRVEQLASSASTNNQASVGNAK